MIQKEQLIWEQVDLILYPAADEVSEVEQWLRAQHSRGSAQQIPLYSYTTAELEWADEDKVSQHLSARILFVAGFAHHPNVDSAEWFLRDVWPLVVFECESAKLALAGSNPCARVRNLISDYQASRSIETFWNIDDKKLQELYLNSSIAVAPILYGAGVNGKIVEALRYGLPCVTTSAGARGLGEPTAGICVADSKQEFAKYCVDLLSNTSLHVKIAGEAKERARREFSQEALLKSLKMLIHPDKAPLSEIQ